MKKSIFLLLIIGAIWKLYNYSGQVSLGPGVMAPDVPQQKYIDSPISFRFGEYNITEIAVFDIKAKVLSKKNYRLDREADLSPVDLALGWGNMSDESVLEKIKISQTGRFYRWKVDSLPIPRREIEIHSANMHLIPANESVKSKIDKVRKGDIIEISGSLVNVKSSNDNWYWKSSKTRNDTGAGACELIFVKKLDIVTL
ncbi:hypothetical protein Maes01_01977 [Microbulbifer aestuariivivens]|uniref:Lipid/polyisoprenoid-binding YceI-like domain-containing protein n=1 Tax=Microbulbifer aestuariivivens TaxID=1908308 RepID=A0ABP9WQC9_9GAMM